MVDYAGSNLMTPGATTPREGFEGKLSMLRGLYVVNYLMSMSNGIMKSSENVSIFGLLRKYHISNNAASLTQFNAYFHYYSFSFNDLNTKTKHGPT